MTDVRRIIIIFVIAVLFTIFVNVAVDAFYQSPQYDDYCNSKGRDVFEPIPAGFEKCARSQPSDDLRTACTNQKGMIAYEYNETGCPVNPFCETCHVDYDDARARYNFVIFLVSALAGLIALVAGLYLPQKKNVINEWVGSGFLLGGLCTIFVGTVRYFGDMGRYMRPGVILIELVLVIYLAYKKLGKK